MKDISEVIMSGLDASLKQPRMRTHISSSIEHELYYQKNGKYPDNSEGFKIPEDIREKALDIEDRLFK